MYKKVKTKNFKNAGKLGTNDNVYSILKLLCCTSLKTQTERFDVAYLPRVIAVYFSIIVLEARPLRAEVFGFLKYQSYAHFCT